MPLSATDLPTVDKDVATVQGRLFARGGIAHGELPRPVQAGKRGAVEFLPKPFSEDAGLNARTSPLT